MDRRGLLWIVVGRCGSLWDRCGSLWIVVDRCGSLWVVPGFSNYEIKSLGDGRLCSANKVNMQIK